VSIWHGGKRSMKIWAKRGVAGERGKKEKGNELEKEIQSRK